MPGPFVGVGVRYLLVRGGAVVGRALAKRYGKRTAQKRMQSEAVKRGGEAFAPAPQGPFVGPFLQSRGGEHASAAGPHPTRKSMRGPSAKKPTRQRRRSKAARRLRAKKYCRKHKRYDMCHMYTKRS